METLSDMCSMCLSSKGDDILKLFQITTEGTIINKLGEMYETFLNIKIVDYTYFPSCLCSSCSLQLQLSVNLRNRALESYKNIISFTNASIKKEKISNSEINNLNEEYLGIIENAELLNETIETEETDYTEEMDETSNGASPIEFEVDCFDNDDDIENDSPEFLDVQYLKDEYDDDSEGKNLADNDENLQLSLNNFYKEPQSDIENLNKSSNLIEIHEIQPLIIEKDDIPINNNLNFNCDAKKKKKKKKRTKFFCDLCTKISYSKEAFEVHKKVHAGLPAFKCEICEKNFNQKVHYNIHMMNHTNERNFACELCGKKFKTKSDLRIHFEIHTGERRYVCDICNKAYRAHSHMKNHRYTHFEKQLECQVCKQKYISPATLKTHIKTIHEMVYPKYECTLCQKKFKRKHHLQVHMKTHDKNKRAELPLEILEVSDFVHLQILQNQDT